MKAIKIIPFFVKTQYLASHLKRNGYDSGRRGSLPLRNHSLINLRSPYRHGHTPASTTATGQL